MVHKEYNDKRDFSKTPEPQGSDASATGSHRFVIQRHRARKLHYDLRLEIDGTLKSWAVPKGPSMNPNDKRLSVRTEDHPLKYLHFHGTIPKGNYGAGEMGIWDSGNFDIDTTENDLGALQQFQKGNLKLLMHGQKIKGRFALVRTGEHGGKESWLLIKKKDAFSTDLFYDAEALVEPSQQPSKKYSKEIAPGQIVQPMLAGSAKEIFNDPEWIYELKWDGYRVLAHISNKGVLLQSRNGIRLNGKFPELARDLENLEHDTILDGEVTVLDENGVSRFGELQNWPDTKGTLRFYVFDMLYLNGHGMLDLSLLDRKSLIPDVIEGLHLTQYCDHIVGMGSALFDKAIGEGMEGVMAKTADSNYVPGARTEKWLKIKSVESEDALICGYTDSTTGGAAFGSLILGKSDGEKLKYIGNCGSGFSEAYRTELLETFGRYRTKENPFGKKLALKGRKPNWMAPVLECEVNYSERTKNGLLRNPVFKRLFNAPEISKATTGTRILKSETGSGSREIIKIDGLDVSISNLEKMYWPTSGYTKYDLIDYYLQVSDTMVPYLRNRPQSLHRHPNGILEESFFQKDNENVPEWMQTVTIHSKSSERDIDYLLCQNTASLIYMANLGCIEIHPWNSSTTDLDRPDYGIIDLDPPQGMDFKNVVKVALTVHQVLKEADIEGYCKTSGAKGLHVYLPMGGNYRYEEVRNFIKLICYFVQQRIPDITTMERRIKNREGKIYLDFLQNRKGQTVAAPYSVRPVEGAQVSAPLHWGEVEYGLGASHFTIKNMAQRLAKEGDLFAPVLEAGIDMGTALESLENMED
ncbi:bifunctional non-homologous end joining protein LigD [Pricia antarctica]|uniref:DNA ligase (ATP) n=1 Tax=Pricia antarctica TaxID=641691 RepID=A0A1G7I888_9FLAO|nr:DNA ligase D [Pricia antarctica]SDF08895.1 bifunctional non-homologous end joining protein LigD [Pricia antarctica]